MSTRVLCCLVIAAVLAGCSGESGARADVDRETQQRDTMATSSTPAFEPPDSLLLTPDGWGPLRIGMSRAEVVAAAGEDANPGAVGGPDPERCDEFRPRHAPDGVLVMIENDTLTRISIVRNREIATPAGLHVGAASADVLRAHGADARVTPHKYVASPAKYITVWREPRRGLLYEIGADDRVTALRAGGPSIEYVEGCL